MANKDNQSKQYRIYIKESKSWVDVNKEFYTNYYRDINTYRKRQQEHGRCVCPASKRYLCDIKKRFDVREIKSSKDITDWNAGKIPVEVIHPASAGHGLKLQAGGSTLIWFGLTWSLELYQQTNARLWRQGQASGTVVIEHIITKRKYKSTTIVFLDTRKTRTATSSSIQNRQKS